MNARINRPIEQDRVNKIVGSNLQYIRKMKNMTQSDLANLLSVRFQQVGKYELGQNQMCAYRLWKAAKVLNTKVECFYDEHFIAKNKALYEAKFFNNGEVKAKDFQDAFSEQLEQNS